MQQLKSLLALTGLIEIKCKGIGYVYNISFSCFIIHMLPDPYYH